LGVINVPGSRGTGRYGWAAEAAGPQKAKPPFCRKPQLHEPHDLEADLQVQSAFPNRSAKTMSSTGRRDNEPWPRPTG
jgi:hypothetical protein